MIRKIVKFTLLFGLVFLFIWTIYFLYSKSQQDPVVFETITPFDTTIVKKTVATGSVIPRREVNMKSQVSGIIEKLEGVDGIAVSRFTVSDVVRHPIVGRIVEAYEGPTE